MPKFSLKRRHNRQNDLCLLLDAPVDGSLNRETASRIVSDDDIQCTSPTNEMKQASQARYSSIRKVPSLQLLHGLADLTHDTCFTPCTSPMQRKSESRNGSTSVLSSSPWGQFVDMIVIPVSPSEDSCNESVDDLSNQSKRKFLPFCPYPQTIRCHRHHPYKRPQPSLAPRHHRMQGAFGRQGPLHFPIERIELELEDTQDALRGLSF
jgi:hypothetical protein